MKTTIGVLLIAHAPLASAFARAADDIGLPVSSLATLDITPDMPRERAFVMASMLIAELPCDGCLVLTDLGGCCTPAVVAQQLQHARGKHIQAVAGLSMPMLATALCRTHEDVSELARHVAQRAAEHAAAA